MVHYCALGSNGWEAMQQERVRRSQEDIGKIDVAWAASGGGVILNFKRDRKGKGREGQGQGAETVSVEDEGEGEQGSEGDGGLEEERGEEADDERED